LTITVLIYDCPFFLQDVVYYFKPKTNSVVSISLCTALGLHSDDATASFAAQVYVLENVDNGGAVNSIACGLATTCDIDGGHILPVLTVSMEEGVGYAVVVDSIGTSAGGFKLSMEAEEGKVQGSKPPATLAAKEVWVSNASKPTGEGPLLFQS
jgi:hypothetical protein